MSLSLHRLFGMLPTAHRPLSGVPSLPHLTESPSFLHPNFALLAPDLTSEVRQALGEQAASRTGDLS